MLIIIVNKHGQWNNSKHKTSVHIIYLQFVISNCRRSCWTPLMWKATCNKYSTALTYVLSNTKSFSFPQNEKLQIPQQNIRYFRTVYFSHHSLMIRVISKKNIVKMHNEWLILSHPKNAQAFPSLHSQFHDRFS